MFCHAGPSSLVVFAGCFKILLSDFRIQILKNGLQFKLKLHIYYGEVHCDRISTEF